MSSLEITLPRALKKWIKKEAAAQGFENASAFVRHLIAQDMRRCTIADLEEIEKQISERARAQGLTEEQLEQMLRDIS